MNIDDKVAVITGGASGLGAAAAEALVSAGAKVFLLDLNKDTCQAMVNNLGAEACGYAITDVADEDSVNAALSQAVEAFGKLHIVVNCAGVGTPGKIVDREGEPLPLAKFRKVVDINLIGTFNVMSKAAAIIAKQDPVNDDGERGVVINCASVAATDGQIGQPAYASSKAGVVGLTLPAARELTRQGIRVNTICPGLFLTPMVETLTPEIIEALANNVEFPKRLGHPAEFAQLVVQMAENTYLNGETVRLDGALRMQAR